MKKEEYKPNVSVLKLRGEWKVRFTIGEQGFFLDTKTTTQKEAKWFAKCLKTALMNAYESE